MHKYGIVEIFSSIQGEGCNLGRRANFVRFAGCNLNCKWCDTNWSKAAEHLSIPEIIDRLDPKAKLVVFTGGEPLLQAGLCLLAAAVSAQGYDIAVETNGTLSTAILREAVPNVWVACSPKPDTNWSINEHCVYDELKYVVDGMLKPKNIAETDKRVWLQPEGSSMRQRWAEALAMIDDLPNRDVRIGVQLHKIMEVK